MVVENSSFFLILKSLKTPQKFEAKNQKVTSKASPKNRQSFTERHSMSLNYFLNRVQAISLSKVSNFTFQKIF